MSYDITKMNASSGRIVKENNEAINIVDLKTGTMFTFHDGESPAGNGNTKTINGEKEMRVGIKGNISNSSIECYGVNAVGDAVLLTGYDLTFTEYTTITDSEITLTYDVTAFNSVYFTTGADSVMIKAVFIA